MSPPRKIAIFPQIKQLAANASYRVWQQGNPNTFVANASVMADATGVPQEAEVRAEADAQLRADLSVEATARQNADVAETTARQNADAAEASTRASQDSTLQTNINNEAAVRANGDTASFWAQLNFSGLPTTDPGGGRPWLSGGFIKVGP